MPMSTNNFLENELRKLFGNDDMFSNTNYISGVCYGELDSDLKIKCQIADSCYGQIMILIGNDDFCFGFISQKIT